LFFSLGHDLMVSSFFFSTAKILIIICNSVAMMLFITKNT
jgi:hypothetical protein